MLRWRGRLSCALLAVMSANKINVLAVLIPLVEVRAAACGVIAYLDLIQIARSALNQKEIVMGIWLADQTNIICFASNPSGPAKRGTSQRLFM